MKKAFLFILLLPLVAYSQDKPTIDKSYYVGENGKLYWYGKKPVYLFIADNPEGNDLKRLESQKHKNFTNPLYLDTEGINYFRTNWAADSTLKQYEPKFELLFEVYRDSRPPVTVISLAGATKFKNKEGVQYYGQNLTLNSKAVDQQSGVQNTFLSIDNENFQAFDGKKTLDQNKEYDLKIYSADNTGNVEPIQIHKFNVDLTSPNTEYVLRNDRSGMIFSPRTIIELNSVDAGAGVRNVNYKIDQGNERKFGTQISLSSLEEGVHSIRYYGFDNVNNKEEEKLVEFYLDRTPPVVEATIVGDQYQNRGRVFISTRTKVKLTAEDNKAGVKTIKFSVDGSEEETYYEPFALDKSKGSHLVTYYAVDKVNNRFDGKLEESNLSRSSLDIDMVAPDIKYDFNGPQYHSRDTSFISGKSTISLSAEDADSGVKDLGYKLNGGTGQKFEGPIQLEEEGIYKIDFYGTDQVNNRNTKTFIFVVDNTGPEIEHILSMDPIGTIELEEKDNASLNVYSKGVKLFLAATDKVIDTDKIFYTINGGVEMEYTKPISIDTKGIVTYQVRATDKLGNSSTSDEIEIFVK